MLTIRDVLELARSTRTLRRNLRAQIPSTWTRTRKKCCKSVVPDLQTPKVRKQKERRARRSWKRPADSCSCKSKESLSRLELTFTVLKKSRVLTITSRYPSRLKYPRVATIQPPTKLPALTFSNRTKHSSKSSTSFETKRRRSVGLWI